MEQSKTMEYGSQKASSDVVKPCYIYISQILNWTLAFLLLRSRFTVLFGLQK